MKMIYLVLSEYGDFDPASMNSFFAVISNTTIALEVFENIKKDLQKIAQASGTLPMPYGGKPT